MKLRRKKYIYWMIAAIILLFAIRLIVKISSVLYEEKPYSKSTLNEYRNLFPVKARLKLSNVWNYNSTIRNQFSLFDYEKDKKYCILIYKIPVEMNFSLKNIYVQNDNNLKGSGGYIVINENYTEFNYKIEGPNTANNIKLFYLNGIFKLINSNDSIVSYYYFGKRIALTLNDENKPDIYGGVKNNHINLPFNITFIRKKQKVYLIIMTVNNLESSFDPSELNNILYGQLR